MLSHIVATSSERDTDLVLASGFLYVLGVTRYSTLKTKYVKRNESRNIAALLA